MPKTLPELTFSLLLGNHPYNHRDHARSMGIFQRKFGLPIHVTRPRLAAAQASMPLGDLSEVRRFTAGSTLDFGTVQVETIPTPHDGVDGVAFVVDDGRSRLGILTDLGSVFSRLEQVIGTLDAVLLESNTILRCWPAARTRRF